MKGEVKVSCHLICSILVAWLCCGMMVAHAQERPAFSRRVFGYVKDRENQPVLKAKVCAQPHSAWTGPIPCGVSKADGRFTLDVWRPGTYTISAEHLVEGHPEVTNGFYGSFFGELPIITVDKSNELKPIEVRVGPKAGRVIFKIFDDESGQLIKSGLVKVCRTDNPKMCMSMSTAFPRGKYELLTPEVPFTIKFEIWGSSQEWEERSAIDEAGGSVEVLQMDLGVRKEITVRLRRVQGNR
ncbi:MAG TPA: carboxypeptidase-like regulatory domain-containing protein [Pyrinomonadaceae bacterium]|nr:carboxypeptidase-like regulatory domain-containing protein [Pyrinomonadaceae bacterium]